MTTGERTEVSDAVATMQQLTECENALQDHFDELHDQSHYEDQEEDPFNFGHINFDGTTYDCTQVWTKQTAATAQLR